MDAADVPLLNVGGMRIRQPEQTLGKMPHNRVPMQKFLIIEPLRQKLFLSCGAYQCALVGENKLFLRRSARARVSIPVLRISARFISITPAFI